MTKHEAGITAHAKKAIIELEATEGMTMRGDAHAAKNAAEKEIGSFHRNGLLKHLQAAVDALAEGIAGTRGSSLHAERHFENAIRELIAVPEVEPPDDLELRLPVLATRHQWDVVLHSLGEDMDQLTPASVTESEWVGDPPHEEEVSALASVHEVIMRQVIGDE